MTVKWFKKNFFKYVRPLLFVPKDVSSGLPESHRAPENVFNAEYNYFFEQIWHEMMDDDVTNPLYKL